MLAFMKKLFCSAFGLDRMETAVAEYAASTDKIFRERREELDRMERFLDHYDDLVAANVKLGDEMAKAFASCKETME